MGGDDGLRPGPHEVMEQRHQPEGGGERQRSVGLVHEVEARLVHAGEQYLEEALPVAQLVEPLLLALAGVLFQVGIEAVHGVRAQEIGPVGPDGPALDDQLRAQSRLAVTGAEEPRLGRSALRVEPARFGQDLHHGGLAGTVLADQHGQAGWQLQPLAEHLLHRWDRRGPPGSINRGTRVLTDRADCATIRYPCRTVAADGHISMMPRTPTGSASLESARASPARGGRT